MRVFDENQISFQHINVSIVKDTTCPKDSDVNQSMQYQTFNYKFFQVIAVQLLALIVFAIIFTALAINSESVTSKSNLVQFSFLNNMSYNYILSQNTTYIKEGSQSVSETRYFSKIICQESNKQYFDLLFIVLNVSVKSKDSAYNYSVFPDVQNLPVQKQSRSLQEVAEDPNFKAFVQSFLTFRFRYNTSSAQVQNISYPTTISFQFKVLIPKVIEMFLPAVNNSIYTKSQGVAYNRTGLGMVVQKYQKQLKDGRLSLKKTFEKEAQNQSKLNNSFTYFQQAVFQGTRLFQNYVTSQTKLKSSQQSQGVVNNDMLVRQKVGLDYVSQYILPQENVSVFQKFFTLNKLQNKQSLAIITLEIIEQGNKKQDTPIQKRELLSLTQQGIVLLEFQKQKNVFSTNFFGLPIRGTLTMFFQLLLKNQSNLFKPTFQSGAYSKIIVGEILDFKIAEKIIKKQTKPISFGYTLNKIISFILKHFSTFQKIFEVTKTIFDVVLSLKDKQLFQSLNNVNSKFGQIGAVILSQMNKQNVAGKQIQMLDSVTILYNALTQKVLGFVNSKMTLMIELQGKAIEALQTLKAIGISQLNLIKEKCLYFSRQLVYPQRLTDQNNKMLDTIKVNAQSIMTDNFIAQQYLKSKQLLKPVYQLYQKFKSEGEAIKKSNEQLSTFYQNSVNTIVKSVGEVVSQSQINLKLNNFLTKLSSRSSSLNSIKDKITLLKQGLTEEIRVYLNSMIPQNNILNVPKNELSSLQTSLQNSFQNIASYLQSARSIYENQRFSYHSFVIGFYRWYNYSPNDFKFEYFLMLQSISFDKTKSLSYSYQFQRLSEYISSLNTLKLQLTKVSDQAVKVYNRMYNVSCYYACSNQCDLSNPYCVNINLENTLIYSIQYFGLVLQQLKLVIAKITVYNNNVQALIDTINKNQASRKSYSTQNHNFLLEVLGNVNRQFQLQGSPALQIYDQLKVNFETLKSQLISQKLAKENIKISIKMLEQKISLSFSQIISIEKDNFKALSESITAQKLKIKDSILFSSFVNKIITLLNTVLNNLIYFDSQSLTNQQSNFNEAVSNLLAYFGNLSVYQSAYTKQKNTFLSLNNKISLFNSLCESQAQKAQLFFSWTQFQNSLQQLMSRSQILVAQLQKTYNLQMNSTIQLFSLFLRLDILQAKKLQLQNIYIDGYISKNNIDFKSTSFLDFNNKINLSLQLIKGLDFDILVLYKSAQSTLTILKPEFNKAILILQNQMKTVIEAYVALSLFTQNFKIIQLNQVVNTITKSSLMMQINSQNLKNLINFKIYTERLKKIQKNQFKSSRDSMITSFETLILFFLQSQNQVKQQLAKQYNEFVPLIQKFSLTNVNSVLQTLRQLNSLPQSFMDNVFYSEVIFIKEAISQLEISIFQKLLKIPQKSRQILTNIKTLFIDQVNQKIKWIINNVTTLKENSPNELKARIESVVSLCVNTVAMASDGINPYFQIIEKSIQNIEININKVNFNFINILVDGLQSSKTLQVNMINKLNQINQKIHLMYVKFNILFNIQTQQLKSLGQQLDSTSNQIIATADTIKTEDNVQAHRIIDNFKEFLPFRKKILVPFSISSDLQSVVNNLQSKVNDLYKKLSENLKEKMVDKIDSLKKGEKYAKTIILGGQKQEQQSDTIVLFQEKSKNLLQKLKMEYSMLITTPVGCIIISFGFQFAAFIGVSVSIQQFRTLAGQFYVQGYVDLYISLTFGVPKILQFGVRLLGRFFNTKFVIGLYIQNIIPLSFIPFLKNDDDMKKDSNVIVRIKAFILINSFSLYINMVMRYLWFKIYVFWLKVCLWRICFKIPLVIPIPQMRQILLPKKLLAEGPSWQIQLFNKKLLEFTLW